MNVHPSVSVSPSRWLTLGIACLLFSPDPLAAQGIAFDAPREYRGVIGVAIAVSDLNQDGRLDLAVGDSDRTISILFGSGDGTFRSIGRYDVGADDIAAADLNADRRPDLVAVNAGGASILIGNGDGTFRPPVHYPAGQSPKSVALGDLNGDGRLDLAVANSEPFPVATVSVLLGTSDGGFRPPVMYAVGSNPRSIAAGDFNADNRLDLAVANRNEETLSILVGRGDGTFSPALAIDVRGIPESVLFGDVNGDARADLIVGKNPLQITSPPAVWIRIGGGGGAVSNYPVGTYPLSVVLADLNNDRVPDLATINGGSDKIYVLMGNGDGTFQAATTHVVGTQPRRIAAGDFDGDGRLDLVVAWSSQISVLLNRTPN